MALPLMFLCFGSIFSGFFFRDLFTGPGTCFFNDSIFILPNHYSTTNAEFIPLIYKILPTIFGFCGATLSFLFYSKFLHKLVEFK